MGTQGDSGERVSPDCSRRASPGNARSAGFMLSARVCFGRNDDAALNRFTQKVIKIGLFIETPTGAVPSRG